MRIVFAAVVVVLLCCAGYGVAFQQPATRYVPPVSRHPAVRPEPLPSEGQVSYTVSAPGPVLFEEPVAQSSQMSVLISKGGLRFISPRADVDIDHGDLPADTLMVICTSTDVTTDAQGKLEVVCQDAAVIKVADMGGKANRLRYKNGLVVLEGEDTDSVIARNKGDKTVFLLRAKTIHVDLNTQQIEASDGSRVQFRREAKPVEGQATEPVQEGAAVTRPTIQ